MTNATDTNKTLGESMFAQCGYAQDAIDKRVSQVWHEIFEGRTNSIGRTTKVLPM